jgi:hypothetical protein
MNRDFAAAMRAVVDAETGSGPYVSRIVANTVVEKLRATDPGLTTATIQPLPSGAAVLELHGTAQDFPSWEAAVAEARRRGAVPNVLPFPPTPIQTLATAPALGVLT